MREVFVRKVIEECGCTKIGLKTVNNERWNEEVLQKVRSKNEAWLKEL